MERITAWIIDRVEWLNIEPDSYAWIAVQVVLILFATAIVTKLFRVIWRKFAKDTIHMKFLGNVITTMIGAAGLIGAISRMPMFSDFAGALLAGSGIAAIVLGLAAQDSLGNAFNGLFLSLSKPFEVGDRIHLVQSNITGFVEDINIRHTVIRTILNSRIIIPNSVISKELIENSDICDAQASGFIDITVVYGSDITRACEIMAEVIGSHPQYVDTRTPEQQETDPLVVVLVRRLDLFGIELRASMRTENIAVSFEACSDVRKSIIEEFGKAGIIPAQAPAAFRPD